MKEKIINIKDILKIVIMVLIIFSAIKSCSKAASNFEVLANQIKILSNKGLLGANAYNNFIEKEVNSTMKSELESGRKAIILIPASNSPQLANKLVIDLVPANTEYVESYGNWWYVRPEDSEKIYYSDLNWSYAGINTNSGGFNGKNAIFRYAYTPVRIISANLNLQANEEYGGNYLSASFTFTPFKDEVVTIDNISDINAKKNIYQYADATLGKVEEYLEENRFTLMELTQDNNLVAYVKYNNLSKQVINSSYMGIEVADNADPPYDLIRVNNWRLYLNQIYTLNIYNGDENVSNSSYSDKQTFNYIFLKSNAVITNGIITNYGSGDGFTNQDSTNAIIDNSNQNNGFWENAYNNLFVVSGDYIENKLNEVKNNLGFSGDYEEEKAFINLINDQNGDFIISWNNYTPHFSLKGEQIDNVQMISEDSLNFSQLERENEEFHEVMTWTRTLIGFSLGYLLIHNYWKTLMLTLGVRSTSLWKCRRRK